MEASGVNQENGLQLMGRFEQRPSLRGLNNHLFPSGLLPREVVEITGESALGKTYMLMDLIARCVLPSTVMCGECEKPSGGLEAGVFLLDQDHHFDLLKLVRIMEVRVKMFLKDIDDSTVDKVISASLKRLVTLHLYSDDELTPSLLSVQNYIFSNSNVSLVAMDSIGAHYWQSVAANGKRKIDTYVEDILKQVHQILGAFQVSFVYTRPAAFASKFSGLPPDLSNVWDLRNVNTKVKLKLLKGNTKIAEVHSKMNIHSVSYEICDNGIEWSST
ncbi:X-ray repair complementing defective repair in Chinese hamster cells 2 [Nesidiocoris tenuis]|uniref:X-ray repair complementing defective repair in Chinese hamster cells 2 n=1 Tax=Nesidiocoris tenuis TaxID=355587 RepID=A0ABN7A7D4_9HEMI|nr:X-ray repair complementing defective repair in Chinese hamster cells 2 [Nesidiocoris tenuis]